MSNTENRRKAPCKSHIPVVTVDYENIDKKYSGGDAIFIDLGQSLWDKNEFSAKVWRTGQKEEWSRRSEELPLGRVLDLAILVSAVITKKHSILNEWNQNESQVANLNDFLTDNISILGSKLNELRRILQPTEPALSELENKEIPNIFSFATSELSQDAMFSWLLSWAAPKYKSEDEQLHKVAQSFVKLLTANENLDIKQIKVYRQIKNIDIVAEINDDKILIIEDKTKTTIHNNQLEKYKDAIKKEYPNHNKYFTYVKIGNEPLTILKTVDELGYKVIQRKDILECLREYEGNNILLCNYKDHLQKIEDDTLSFAKYPVSEWSWYAWEGFFKKLEEEINITDWNYVPNKSGGFLGAWWHFTDFSKGEMYLQFEHEQKKLCFKIAVNCEKNERSSVRNECKQLLINKAKERSIEITIPKMGWGVHMTIAQIGPENIFGNDNIDLGKIKDIIKNCEQLINDCCKELNMRD